MLSRRSSQNLCGIFMKASRLWSGEMGCLLGRIRGSILARRYDVGISVTLKMGYNCRPCRGKRPSPGNTPCVCAIVAPHEFTVPQPAINLSVTVV
jgi:hypothetical protein